MVVEVLPYQIQGQYAIRRGMSTVHHQTRDQVPLGQVDSGSVLDYTTSLYPNSYQCSRKTFLTSIHGSLPAPNARIVKQRHELHPELLRHGNTDNKSTVFL